MSLITITPGNKEEKIEKTIFVECEECHKIYLTPINQYKSKKDNRKFICSKDCIKKFNSKTMINGWLTGVYKRRKVEVICYECNKVYNIPLYDYNRKKKLNQKFLCSKPCLKIFFAELGKRNWSNMGYKKVNITEKERNDIIKLIPIKTSKEIACNFKVPVYFVDNLMHRLKLKKTKEHLTRVKSMAGKIGGKIGGIALVNKRKEEGTFESFTKLGGKASVKKFKNENRFKEWQKKGNASSYKVKKTCTPHAFDGESFLSKQEMNWYEFYKKLGLNKTEINHDFNIDNRHIDFFPLNKFFHEHHPFMKLYDGEKTPEKYFKERREILDSNGYQQYPLVHTQSIKERNKIKRLVRFYGR